MNKTALYMLIVLIIFTSQSSGLSNSDKIIITGRATQCYPEYKCENWGPCIEGLESRVCIDLKCDKKEIIERKFCEELSCKPLIKCSEWSECTYTDKTENILEGNIKFGGYKNRDCKDITKCIDPYSEERSCEDIYTIELEKITQCNENYMVATDPLSGKEIARINLDSWKNKKLDLIFLEGKSVYCSSCYNGIKDINEEDIDCGGDCKECVVERNFPVNGIIYLFIILSIISTILLINEIALQKKFNKNKIKKSFKIYK